MTNAELLILVAKPGDRVTANFPAGVGRHGVEYKPRSGKVRLANTTPGVLVIDLGGRFGTPGSVTAKNILKLHISERALAERIVASGLKLEAA